MMKSLIKFIAPEPAVISETSINRMVRLIRSTQKYFFVYSLMIYLMISILLPIFRLTVRKLSTISMK